MIPHYGKLTPEEKERNKHGPMAVFTYSEESLGIYKAPAYFPDVDSYARMQLVDHKDIIVPREKLVKGLSPGVRRDMLYLGFATLQYVEHTASLQKGQVKIFSFPSRWENWIIRITPKAIPDTMSIAAELLGKTVCVNWPYLKEAQVVAVSDSERKINLINPQKKYCNENVNIEELTEMPRTQWRSEKKRVTDMYKESRGIDLGETNILIHARVSTGIKYTFRSQGKFCCEKQWSDATTPYPYQVVVKELEYLSIAEPLYKSVGDVFTPGTVCFMLGQPHYGAMGQVLQFGPNERAGRVSVTMNVTPEPSLDAVMQAQVEQKTRYMPGHVAALHLGISTNLFNKVTGTILVTPSSDETRQKPIKYNIGFNLKSNKTNQEIPGYTRKENGCWQYSNKTIDMTRKYMRQYPDLFERLSRAANDDHILEEKLFARGSGELNEVLSWLKEQHHGVEKRPCGVEALEPSIIKKMEEELDAAVQSQGSDTKQVLMHVKLHYLFNPSLHMCDAPPDPKARHYLFDRVCCVRENFAVPLGYKGVIIGIQKSENAQDITMYDVLFDKPFTGGLSIYGCSNYRAFRLSSAAFINISHGERVARGIGGAGEVPMEAGPGNSGSWRSSLNQKNQVRSGASAFASVNAKNSRVPNQNPSPEWVHSIKTNHRDAHQKDNIILTLDTRHLFHCNRTTTGRRVHQNSETDQESGAFQNIPRSPPKPASEFQALWNELQKYNKPHKSALPPPPKTVLPPPPPRTVLPPPPRTVLPPPPRTVLPPPPKTVLPPPFKPKIKPPKTDVPQNSPQDPTAFLKAMLKIPDVSTLQAKPAHAAASEPRANMPAPQTEEAMDAPPLIQQLFDHARQTEKGKDGRAPIWYCSQLLNYYQLSMLGMPRYTYFTDGETNLIRAHILLPDKRVFVGDPCNTHEKAAGSAAKKVYAELNMAGLRPDLKNLLPPPQQWYASQQNPPRTSVRPPMMPNFTEVKQETKHSPAFVPLQAQKTCRYMSAKQAAKKANKSAKDDSQTVESTKCESAPKTSKAKGTVASNKNQTPAQTNSQQVQNSQRVARPKRSRVAAKFGMPSQVEENHHTKKST